MEYFPFPTPREEQKRLIKEVLAAFERADTVILEAPPGVGKTAIGATIAKYFYQELHRQSYCVTATIDLQQQYLRDFDFYKLLIGRTHFECRELQRLGKPDTCEAGYYSEIELQDGGSKKRERYCPECTYVAAREEALAAPVTLANYASFLFGMYYGDYINERELLILDEGHDTEAYLLSFKSIQLGQHQLQFLDPQYHVIPQREFSTEGGPSPEGVGWLKEVAGALYRQGRKIGPTKQGIRLRHKSQQILLMADRMEKEPWVVNKITAQELEIKPVFVSQEAQQLLHCAQKRLLMSATIIDAAALAKSLGIRDYVFVQSDKAFPKKQRPIFLGLGCNMSMKNRENGAWEHMVQCIDEILSFRQDRKGIILCPSFRMMEYIRDHVTKGQSKRLLCAATEDKRLILDQHMRSEDPTVLVSASFWEGVDLRDEASRFQILPQLPYPFPDPQVQARSRIDPQWYVWRALVRVVQGYGRSIRNEEDHAETWILDDRILATRILGRLPAWFREAMIFDETGLANPPQWATMNCMAVPPAPWLKGV